MIEREDPGELPFTTFTNDLLNDAALGAEALGVLAYLLSKPANWRVMPAALANRFGCGRDKIYRVLSELVEAGYVRRSQDRGGSGSFADHNYIVSSQKRPLTEKPEAADSPLTEKPYTAKPTLQKKDSTKERLSQKPGEDFFEDERPETKPRKKRQAIPKIYPMTDCHKKYATDRGLAATYSEVVFENFKNHHAAKGTLMLDWDAAWRTWVGNEIKFSAGRVQPNPKQAPPRPGMVYGDDYM